jgi:hypothetical protein
LPNAWKAVPAADFDAAELRMVERFPRNVRDAAEAYRRSSDRA